MRSQMAQSRYGVHLKKSMEKSNSHWCHCDFYLVDFRQWGGSTGDLDIYAKNIVLHYQLVTTHNQRSSTCWQQFTVSPASSEWLKDNVSMNSSIDTVPSSYVWSALRTLEWLSQVLESLIQLNAIVTYYCERHLRVISCLLLSIQTNVYKPM